MYKELKRQLFPISVLAYDNGHYVYSPNEAISIWQRIRNNRHWYAVSYVILSENPIKISLNVFDMQSFAYGGIGKRLYSEEVTKFTPEEKAKIESVILEKKTELAEKELEQREEEIRQNKILTIRQEIFGV